MRYNPTKRSPQPCGRAQVRSYTVGSTVTCLSSACRLPALSARRAKEPGLSRSLEAVEKRGLKAPFFNRTLCRSALVRDNPTKRSPQPCGRAQVRSYKVGLTVNCLPSACRSPELPARHAPTRERYQKHARSTGSRSVRIRLRVPPCDQRAAACRSRASARPPP